MPKPLLALYLFFIVSAISTPVLNEAFTRTFSVPKLHSGARRPTSRAPLPAAGRYPAARPFATKNTELHTAPNDESSSNVDKANYLYSDVSSSSSSNDIVGSSSTSSAEYDLDLAATIDEEVEVPVVWQGENFSPLSQSGLAEIQALVATTASTMATRRARPKAAFAGRIRGKLIQIFVIQRMDGLLEIILKNRTPRDTHEVIHESLMSLVVGNHDKPYVDVATIDSFRKLEQAGIAFEEKEMIPLLDGIRTKLTKIVEENRPIRVLVSAMDVSPESQMLAAIFGAFLEPMFESKKVLVVFWRNTWMQESITKETLMESKHYFDDTTYFDNDEDPIDSLICDVVLLTPHDSFPTQFNPRQQVDDGKVEDSRMIKMLQIARNYWSTNNTASG